MAYLIQFPLILLLCLLQLSLAENVAFVDARPNLLLVGVVAWSIFGGVRHGLFWAIAGGLILDSYSAGPFGAFTSLYVLTALGVAGAAAGLEIRNLFPPLVFGFAASILFDTLTLIFFQSVGRSVDWGVYLLPVILPGAVYNGLLTGVIYWPLFWLHRRFVIGERR